MMRYTLAIAAFVAAMLALAPAAGDSGQGKGGRDRGASTQQVDRDRPVDGDRIRDQNIYGHELMSRGELQRYREQLEQQQSDRERELFQARHEARMRERAMQQNKELVPPGQGPIYGGELMSVQERNEYRERLRLLDSDAERTRFEARHREEMDLRARALGLDLEEAE